MKIIVTGRDNNDYTLDAIEGWRVMEIIRDHAAETQNPAIAIKAECGGALSCATCHVYVDKKWTDALPPPGADEVDQMDYAFGVEDNSRLSCQIIMNDNLDGLHVTLAPGSEP